ncbi:hypothetical protein BC628DRAFT_492316 [Trametes gibbosa]|nr:hypothetical protein BC628DRAFT_492316 [Trametes gibbosa]
MTDFPFVYLIALAHRLGLFSFSAAVSLYGDLRYGGSTTCCCRRRGRRAPQLLPYLLPTHYLRSTLIIYTARPLAITIVLTHIRADRVLEFKVAHS